MSLHSPLEKFFDAILFQDSRFKYFNQSLENSTKNLFPSRIHMIVSVPPLVSDYCLFYASLCFYLTHYLILYDVTMSLVQEKTTNTEIHSFPGFKSVEVQSSGNTKNADHFMTISFSFQGCCI